MKLLFAAAALAAVAVSAPAFAQTAPQVGGYVNLGVSDTHTGPLNLGSVVGRIGGRAKYFGAEGEASVGFTKDDYLGADVRVKDEFAAYAVGFLPLGPNGDLFARVGYGTLGATASYGGHSGSGHSESVNYGVGAQYFFKGGPNGIRIDATRFDDTHDDGSANVYSISFVRKFGGR